MSETQPPDWALIRRRYEDTTDPVAVICADAGIDQRTFDGVRKRGKWRRRFPRPFPPSRPSPADAPADAPVPAPTPAPGALAEAPPPPPSPPALSLRRLPATPAARRRLVERLVAAISMKLEQLERRMSKDLTSGDDAPATDHERETRAIGALIDNLDKITELEAGLKSHPGRRGAAPAAPDLADEAERCRRELAERLSRLVEAAERPA